MLSSSKILPIIILIDLLSFSSTIKNYDHGIFENFQLTKEIFIHELKLVNQLINLRQNLELNKELLQNQLTFTNKYRKSNYDVQFLMNIFEKYTNILKNDNFPNFEKYGPGEVLYNGANNGLVLLIDSYKLSIKKLLKGIIELPNHKNLVSNVIITPMDLIVLSKKASLMGWYDTAIDLFSVGIKKIEKEMIYNEFPNVDADELLEEYKIYAYKLVEIHNNYLLKNKERAGKNFKVKTYLVDPKTYKKRKRQPKDIKYHDFYNRTLPENLYTSFNILVSDGDYKEEEFRRICRSEIKPFIKNDTSKIRCRYLHHNNPFLKLAPFKIQVLSYDPVRMIIVDIFEEIEMKWLMDYSIPRLSRTRDYRDVKEATGVISTSNKMEAKGRTVHKTVQCWMSESNFTNDADIRIIRHNRDEKIFGSIANLKDTHTIEIEGNGDAEERSIINPILEKLARKIELVTNMRVRGRWSSSQFQTTNYGLGGLCESHLDPMGFIDGMYVKENQRMRFMTGDLLATFMGWLEDVPAGGGTAFDWPGKEDLVMPKRGSAAFWFNLSRAGFRNFESSHGGCPIVSGSKWILNKWIHYYDQWKNYPCGLKKNDNYTLFNAYY